jgi:DNA (cytosine-5)-methyltransferase 1
VPQLARYDKKGVYSDFVKVLKENKYFLSDTQKIVYCPEYGVPQSRKRLVILASKFGDIALIPPIYSKEDLPTVRKAIGQMPKIEDGEIFKEDPFHRAQKLSALNKKRIQNTKEGGSWRDWSDDLKLKCHKKISGSTFGDVYGRMRWDEPAPTLTTHCTGLGNGRFGHPEQHRAISLREAAILQSFPPDYKFSNPEDGEVTYTDLQRHIGNAVPVELGRAIAVSVKQHLQKYFEQ